MFELFSLLFFAPFLVLSFGMLMIGRFMTAGLCRVELGDGQLRVIDRAGGLRWTRTRPVKRLRSFTVKVKIG